VTPAIAGGRGALIAGSLTEHRCARLGAVSPTPRTFAAAACFATWLVALFFGFALGGAVHLVALAGVVLAPWRSADGRVELEKPEAP
jgi:hypothetical protein